MPEPVRLQFIWHFHQPYYGLPGETTNHLPWVRLHAVKSYYDMARMLEEFPDVRATINFSGSLLRQLREYVEEGKRDAWWELSWKAADRLDERDKLHLLRHFFSINWEHCVKRYPRYAELLAKRGTSTEMLDIASFTTADYRDLQVWFNLAWFGFSARRERQILSELIEKDRGFTEAEKEALLEQQIDLMQHVVPLYRELHLRGQVELTVTPMYHPILPLVIDTEAARRATPDRPVPQRFRALDDAIEHVRQARTIAREFLGVDVDGMWPAEGSVSPEALEIFETEEVAWVATDEDVLRASRGDSWDRDKDLYRPWRLAGRTPAIFFRDHGLSDTIGFVYARNDPRAAARDFLDRVRQSPGPVVNVILDGENPWEHYPNDGEAFLRALYEELGAADDVETTYPMRFLETDGCDATLDRLHSGSWILGNYQIWIGHPETNKAWDYLGRARRDLVRWVQSHEEVDVEQEEAAWEALMIAQGSDWFWWYGDDFTSENDADFDRLFRDQIRAAYTSVGAEPPSFLDTPIARVAIAGDNGFQQPTRFISPRIDGALTSFYEWDGAGKYVNTGSHGSMFDSVRHIEAIFVGFDLDHLFVRVDFGTHLRGRIAELEVRIQIEGARSAVVEASGKGGGSGTIRREGDERARALLDVAFDHTIEFAIPFDDLEVSAGDHLRLHLAFSMPELELGRHPIHGTLDVVVPDANFERRNWLV